MHLVLAVFYLRLGTEQLARLDDACGKVQRPAAILLALHSSLAFLDEMTAEMAQTRIHLARSTAIELYVWHPHFVGTFSGTDAELFAVYCVTAITKRPLLNILVIPHEIVSNSKYAVAGQHFDRMISRGGVCAELKLSC